LKLTSADQKEKENEKQVVGDEENEKEFELVGIQLNKIYLDTIERAKKAQSKLIHFKISNNENKCSCDNLFCYLALREHDLSDLQLRLAEQGLSSLEMLESRVLVSIEQVLKHFGMPRVNVVSSSSTTATSGGLCKVNSQTGNMMLVKRSELLFGQSSKGRRTRIMVTLDSSDIFQYELIEQLLENGLDIVRINCAHNTKREWKLLIESIRTAEERLVQRGIKIGHKCKILMDLGGTKIRTGPVEHKPRPLKISVLEDVYGRPLRLAEGILDSEANQTGQVSLEGTRSGSTFVIAISKIDYGGLGSLKIGQKISFRDARDERLCTLTVLERLSPTKVRVGLEHTAWLKEGTKLECQTNSFVESPGDVTVAATNSGDDEGSSGGTTNHNYATDNDNDNDRGSNNNNSTSTCSFTVGQIKPQPVEIKVEYGNTLRLYRDANRLGHTGDASVSNKPGGISCTRPEVLDHVVVGHRVFIDDGKIEGIVRSSNEEYLELEIISPRGTIAEIKPNKGMNFPDSSIIMPALTPQDIRNLEFVVEHADMVALSFVHRPEDIYDLHKELSKLEKKNHGNSKDLGVIAKIETADSIHNMAKILIAGLELELKFGILIARGDLAVEVGFEKLPFVQEDILCLCEAAHTPVILATQILESLAESGLRTRPEITDAIMGQRAECVMLNNGTHIVEAVKTLSALLNTEERHQIKKVQLLREFFTTQYIM
jgi:pyruvate kinase